MLGLDAVTNPCCAAAGVGTQTANYAVPERASPTSSRHHGNISVVYIWFHLKRFPRTKRIFVKHWGNLKRFPGTKCKN